MSARLSVDADIRRARTLPSRVYCDAAVYDRVMSRVLEPSWQPVADVARLKAPGHVLPFTLLEGSLDEPLVLTRSDDGVARCLSNVCTHRGTVVVEGEGHLQTLRCRYHGRRFGLDGCMRFMPEFDDAEDFPSPSDDLPRLALHEWGPLFFTSLAPSHDFEEWIGPVRARADWMRPERFRFDESRSAEYLIDANWALYCDNYLEGFHVPYVHAGSLAGALDYEGYETEVFEWSNVQVGVAREGELAFDLPAGHPDEGKRIAAWYFFLFPNVMLNFYPWGLSLNVVLPLGPTRSRVLFRAYVADESKLEGGGGQRPASRRDGGRGSRRIGTARCPLPTVRSWPVQPASRAGPAPLPSTALGRAGSRSHSRSVNDMLHAIRAALVTATLVALCAPASAEAQIRRGRADDPAATGWAPASVGLRAGYDSNSRGEVLGAHAHVPFLRNGLLELAPSADITFLTGAKEYQYSLDLAWVSAGREGGLFLGGSLGYRDTVVTVDQSGQRSTLFSYGAVAGFRTGTAGPVQVLVELRWIFLEDSGTSDYRPVPITLGAAFPLWGRG